MLPANRVGAKSPATPPALLEAEAAKLFKIRMPQQAAIKVKPLTGASQSIDCAVNTALFPANSSVMIP